MKPLVSITVCTHNDELFLEELIRSILHQSYKNFELIILCDNTSILTHNILKKFADIRIIVKKYPFKSEGNIAKLRNYVVQLCKGKYIFMTDGDCFVSSNWLSEGLTYFNKYKPDIIEGKIIYGSENYKPTLSDRIIQNLTGGSWMTANIAYTKKILREYKFDENFPRMSDRELALHYLQDGKIPFVSSMIVFHQIKKRDIRGYLKEVETYIIPKIELIKKYDDKLGNPFRILSPEYLITLIFPLAIIFKLKSIKTKEDLKLFPFIWIKAIYMRYTIWKTAISKKVFVI